MNFSRIVSQTITRPADTTAYASGDLVANSTTAGSVTPFQFAVGTGAIRRAQVRKSDVGTTNAQFRLHLYTASPTCANGDNGAWSTDQVATYLGAMDVTVGTAFTDGAAGQGIANNGTDIVIGETQAGIVYGLLEARAAYAPASAETFTVELELYR